MKIISSISVAFLATALVSVGSQVALAQDGRVQQEVIQYTDPTQASADGWRFQASAEYWYMNAPDPRFTFFGVKGSIDGGIAGFSGYASQGNWTVMLSVRPGDYGETFSTTSVPNAFHNKMGTFEMEAKARYLLRDQNWLGFTPYLLGGFHYLQANNHFTYLSGPATYSPWYNDVQTYNTIEAGLGGMRSFGDGWGMRADVSIGAAFGDDKSQTLVPPAGPLVKSSGTGIGYNGYLTVYHYLSDHVVANFGGRAAYIDAPGGPGSLAAIGVFASISYSFDN